MITFAILVENLGIGQAQDVVVTDTLPAGLTFVGANNNLCGGPCADPVVDGPTGRLVVGQPRPRHALAATSSFGRGSAAPLTVGTRLTNTVEIRGANAEVDSDPNDEITDPYANNHRSLTIEIIPPTADLQIYKYVEAGVVAAGESLRYRIMLINQGAGAADDVIVTDTLPLSVTYLTYASIYPIGDPVVFTPTVSGRQVVWNLGSVPAHGWGYLTVDVRVSSKADRGRDLDQCGDRLHEQPGTWASFANESVAAKSPVVSNIPNLWVDKFSDGQRTPGNQFDYRIRLTNNGGGSATGVRVTDTLPAELRFITATSQSCLDPLNPSVCQPNPFTVTVQGRQISWEIGRVPPGIGETYIMATVEVSPSCRAGHDDHQCRDASAGTKWTATQTITSTLRSCPWSNVGPRHLGLQVAGVRPAATGRPDRLSAARDQPGRVRPPQRAPDRHAAQLREPCVRRSTRPASRRRSAWTMLSRPRYRVVTWSGTWARSRSTATAAFL